MQALVIGLDLSNSRNLVERIGIKTAGTNDLDSKIMFNTKGGINRLFLAWRTDGFCSGIVSESTRSAD